MGNQEYLNRSGIKLEASDIQIGAVEIKDGDSDQRATVKQNPNTTNGELLVQQESYIDSNNSTETFLVADDVFTGDSTDVMNAAVIRISIATDQPSVTDGLSVQFSKDATNWDWCDEYTILGPSYKEEISISPSAQYYRIVYTNGSSDQTYFRLSSMIKAVNTKHSSHRIKDELTEQDDVEVNKSVIAYNDTNDGTINNVSIQNPFPVDGDSVYAKDVWEDESDIGNFSGSVTDLFDNLHSVITDTTSNNPKTLIIHFNRTIISNVIGLGCYGGGNFSNVKIEIVTSGEIYTTVYDDSSDNTKYTSLTAQLPITAGFNALRITFHTTDTICLSNMVIPKTRGVVSRLQAAKPDNTVTDINATAGGNLKVSLEELESDISTNSNTQLNTSLYDAAGIGPAEIDNATNTLQIIEYEHHEIHSGSHFNYCDYSLNEGSGNTIEFVMTTPNTSKWIHLILESYSSEGATIELYEGASGISGGTTITPRNNNRNSSNTSDVTFIKDPTTITSDGTRASGFLAGGGRTAGFVKRGNEFVLKQNETYLVRITSLAVSNDISWCAEWYEHTNKNV